MTPSELLSKMDSAEKASLVVWEQDGLTCVGVNRLCVETTLGTFPRRLNFSSQSEFHDAHYSWTLKAKGLATEILENFAQKYGLKSSVQVDVWDKPSLRIDMK